MKKIFFGVIPIVCLSLLLILFSIFFINKEDDKNSYDVIETVEYKDIYFQIVDIFYSDGTEYDLAPAENGKKYLGVSLEVNNQSKKDIETYELNCIINSNKTSSEEETVIFRESLMVYREKQYYSINLSDNLNTIVSGDKWIRTEFIEISEEDYFDSLYCKYKNKSFVFNG